MAIDVSAAVRAASIYANVLYDGKAIGIQLEEVEYDSLKSMWNVTLSFYLPAVVTSPLDKMLRNQGLLAITEGQKVDQHFKQFEVDAEGNVKSMKIRKL